MYILEITAGRSLVIHVGSPMESQDQANDSQSLRHRPFKCPLCRRTVRLPAHGACKQMKFFPFCSERCKLIDLGAWLDTDYRIPSRPDEESEGPPGEGFPGSQSTP